MSIFFFKIPHLLESTLGFTTDVRWTLIDCPQDALSVVGPTFAAQFGCLI